MRKIIKNLWKNHKEKQKELHKQEEKSAFNITEKDGSIYIIAGSRAIKEIDYNTTALDIVKMLEECRNAQINFTKL